MSSKKILLGVAAVTVMNVASAATGSLVTEKQHQAAVMNDLLKGINVVMSLYMSAE